MHFLSLRKLQKFNLNFPFYNCGEDLLLAYMFFLSLISI